MKMTPTMARAIGREYFRISAQSMTAWHTMAEVSILIARRPDLTHALRGVMLLGAVEAMDETLTDWYVESVQPSASDGPAE